MVDIQLTGSVIDLRDEIVVLEWLDSIEDLHEFLFRCRQNISKLRHSP
jgi:hypothetical protein